MKQESTKRQFVICVRNDGNEDLEIGKVYPVLPDELAAQHDYIRVVDESGEDYLYPAVYFVSIVLPHEAERVLLAVSSSMAAD